MYIKISYDEEIQDNKNKMKIKLKDNIDALH